MTEWPKTNQSRMSGGVQDWAYLRSTHKEPTVIGARILVVEDEGIVALDIRNRLTSLGYDVSSVAVSGEEAVCKAAEMRPDLVLMDIQLRGEIDGVETAEQIQSRYNIPVIYITACADEAMFQRAKVTEPFGYLLKPFDERELRTAVEIALYRHQVEERLQQHNRELATLNAIAMALGQSLELQERLRKSVNKVLEAMKLECGDILLTDELGQADLAVQCGKSAEYLPDRPAFQRAAEALLDALPDLPPVFSVLPHPGLVSLSELREGAQLDDLDRIIQAFDSRAFAYHYVVALQSKGRKVGVMSLFGHGCTRHQSDGPGNCRPLTSSCRRRRKSW
jgi:CheY-like chemotaxis protein